MYRIPEENWGAFLSQGDTMWCWAYALGGIFGLTSHSEIAELHERVGQRNPDGTVNDSASPKHVLDRAKEQGYIEDYKSINYALKSRRIQAIMEALEKGIPLYMQKKDTSLKTHEVRVVGFDEEKAQYLVVDSGKINYSPLAISYDVCESLYAIEMTPENYQKIKDDLLEDTKEEVIVDEELPKEETDEIIPDGEEVVEDTMTFQDVKKSDWFYDVVDICHSHGIVSGKSDTIFDPNGNLTRAEVCAIIVRALGLKKKD